MYRNFIFDLYGTLVDIRTDEEAKSLWKFLAGFLARQGAEYHPAELRSTWKRLCAEETEKKREETGSPWPEPDIADVFRRIYEEAPVRHPAERTVDAKTVALTADVFRTLSIRRLRLFAHTEEVLRQLKKNGAGIYLLSNAQHLFTIPEMEMLGILPLFDAVYISSDKGIKKPDPEFMRMLLRGENLRAEESIMIGNELDSDMACAVRTGVRGLFLNTGGAPLSEVRAWEDKMRGEGLSPEIQLAMSGDIRVLLKQ